MLLLKKEYWAKLKSKTNKNLPTGSKAKKQSTIKPIHNKKWAKLNDRNTTKEEIGIAILILNSTYRSLLDDILFNSPI